MKIKKYLMTIISIVGVFLLMTGCASGSASESDSSSGSDSPADNEEEIVLKFASGLPETHALYIDVEKPFMDRVTELTDGQVQFEHYPSEQLGKSADLISLTADGVADITFVSPGYTPSEMPISAALYAMPGWYGDSVEISSVVHNLTKESPILESDYLSNGVRPLMTVFTPSYNIFTNDKEVKLPEDLKGLQLKAAGGVANEALSHLGATPLTIPVGDLYSSMERNVVNGMHSYFQDVVVYDLADIINYATLGLNFGGSGPGYVINDELFQGLPKHIQDAMIQAGDEIVESAAKAYDDANNEAMEKVKGDLAIYEVSEDEKKQWDEAFEEFNEIWRDKQSDEFKEAMDKLQEALDSQK